MAIDIIPYETAVYIGKHRTMERPETVHEACIIAADTTILPTAQKRPGKVQTGASLLDKHLVNCYPTYKRTREALGNPPLEFTPN